MQPSKCRSLVRPMRGVTLIELIVVIVLTAVLASMMAYFIVPFFSYFDAKRRAEMTDVADTALRRMGRDVRAALPNSVRVSPDGRYVELLLLRDGGRYRTDTGSTGGACGTPGGAVVDALDIGSSDICFKTIGALTNAGSVATGASGDFVVVYNLGGQTPNADAYCSNSACSAGGNVTGANKAKISAMDTSTPSETKITFDAANTFPYGSAANRFQIIEGPVTYGCVPDASNPASGTLTRYWGYAISATQNTPPTGAGLSSATLVTNVSDCSFGYDSFVVAQSAGLVSLSLKLGSKDIKGSIETVGLYHAVHVSNVP